MPYWQLFYHIVTATKDRKPLLTSDVELWIFKYIKEKCYDLEGDLFAINGTENHVHLVVAIPPKIAIANFIGQVKGYAASQYNQNNPKASPFLWQSEYGVFSFDKKRLPACIGYVEGQKTHHKNGDLVAALERTGDANEHQLKDHQSVYTAGDPFDFDVIP